MTFGGSCFVQDDVLTVMHSGLVVDLLILVAVFLWCSQSDNEHYSEKCREFLL